MENGIPEQPHFDPTKVHVEGHHLRAWEEEKSFQDQMGEVLAKSPYFAISIIIHILGGLILFLISTAPQEKVEKPQLTSQIQQKEETPEEEPEEEPEEITPEEEPEPVIQDAEVSDHNEEDTQDDFSEVEGEDQNADSQFDSNQLNDVVGIGGGAGGKFGGRRGGRRNLRTRGGRKVADGIKWGLEWLKNHQDKDGHWSSDEFMKHCPSGDVCDGPGNPVNDIGITGLALLAFLGDGSTMRSGPYKSVIKKGINWIRQQMGDDGLIGTENGRQFQYCHAIASYALIEAYGLSRYRTLRPYAQKAVNYIQNARNEYGVWRYFPRDGNNDSSVTGWMIMALKSAKDFKLKVDKKAFDFAGAWYDQVTDPNTGQCGYTKKGQGSAREPGQEDKFPASKTEAMTAVGLFARFWLGQEPDKNSVMLAAADTMLKKPPVWNTADGSIDIYYWYYGSYAMFQIGGRKWEKWKKAMEKAFLPSQIKKGHAKGSWDPISAWGESGGRVYTTALGILSLEVYYRYSRLVR